MEKDAVYAGGHWEAVQDLFKWIGQEKKKKKKE